MKFWSHTSNFSWGLGLVLLYVKVMACVYFVWWVMCLGEPPIRGRWTNAILSGRIMHTVLAIPILGWVNSTQSVFNQDDDTIQRGHKERVGEDAYAVLRSYYCIMGPILPISQWPRPRSEEVLASLDSAIRRPKYCRSTCSVAWCKMYYMHSHIRICFRK